jgi:hypothetical protein
MALGLAGCDLPKNQAIHGTVTRGGEKLTWPNGGTLLVIFFPEDRKANPNVYRAEGDTATSTYTVAAIPPGRYKVAVHQFDPRHKDALRDAYDPVRTTLMFDVPPSGGTIDIDIPVDEHRPKKDEQPNPNPPPPG